MLKKVRRKFASVRLTPWTAWLAFLGLLLVSGLGAGLLVSWKGLSVTHLTDLVPWGLWITIDLSSIALSAGAFSLCAGVYLIGLKRFQPIARTATFVGLIGYTMAVLALMLDIGRPDRFWHSVVYWNTDSLLWEVTMAVLIYLNVLILESMPIFARWQWLRDRWPGLARRMEHTHHYAPFLAVIGLGLSSMHQSSLGAVYGVLKARPFWFKPEMSVLFMFSAIVGGIALTLFASMLASRLTTKARVNDGLIERLSMFLAWVLVGYFYFRFWDTLATRYTYDPGRSEGLQLITQGSLSFNFWVGEMLLGIVVPMILLLVRRTRMNPFWRMVALFLVAAGVVAYRWDTNLAGLLVIVSYLPGKAAISYASYTPSLVEWLAGLGIIAYGLLAFSLGAKYLRVVDHTLIEQEAAPVRETSGESVPTR